MKKLYFLMAFAVIVSCKSKPKGDNTNATEAQEKAEVANTAKTLSVDTENTTITWEGRKLAKSHNGTMNVKSGTLSVVDGKIAAGSFTIDITSLVCLDQDEAGNAKLAGHLLSPDFFDAENHPTASFDIVAVASLADHASAEDVKLPGATHKITGNLNLKGVSKSISFPAKVSINEDVVEAIAQFEIDRTQWGMHYGGDKSLGDRFIKHDVGIGLTLRAK